MASAPTPEGVLALVERIKPLLAGQDPNTQGAALAELLSLWLAAHSSPTAREMLLQMHIQVVRQLTEVNAKMIWSNGHGPN